MNEHADEYFEGKGRRQSDFVRVTDGVAEELPGSQPGMADATSTIIDANGHWLGGRLNVERAVAKVQLIADEAMKIPAPRSDLPKPPNQLETAPE